MSKLIDWDKLNEKSIYNQMKAKLDNQKNIEKLYIQENYEAEDMEEEFEYLEEDYNLYNMKLEFINKLNERNNIDILLKMDSLDNLSEKQRMLMMISYGVLVDYFKKINERTDEEIFMLSSCSSDLDLEDYTYYVGILSDKNVASSVVSKSMNLGEQVKIARAVMDSQDEFPYDYIDADNYDELVENGITVVNNYDIGYIK